MIAAKVNTELKANWEAQKAKLKARFPKLTDEDLNFEENGKDEMLKKLETKLAIPANELLTLLQTL